FDVYPEAVNTFNFNHSKYGSAAYVQDVTQLDVDRLDELAGREFRPVGVLGGPPCQSFSVSNVYQSDDDPRHRLPAAYAALLGKLNRRHPISFFVFENVPGLLGKKHIHRYEAFKEMFASAGFRLYEKLMDAKEYGVPQERERIIIVGINEKKHPDVVWDPPVK